MSVYLDNNATTSLDEAVLESMLPYMGAYAGNPSSLHRYGRLQRDAVEHAREQVARLAGARAEQVIFTSGGTESNNLLLRGLVRGLLLERSREKHTRSSVPKIAISAIEHPSLLQPAEDLADSGEAEILSLPVDAAGRIDLAAATELVSSDTALITVMAANNETGVMQDTAALAEMALEKQCFFHTDASQAAGKTALDFAAAPIHAMTLSAHKFHGPLGAGALIVDRSLPLSSNMHGGAQEKGLRAGTENVPAIVGFGAAAELALQELDERSRHTLELRLALETGLK